MTYSVRATQPKPVEMNELAFDTAFGAGSFLEVVNYHRTLRKLHRLLDEQVVTEAAVLEAALAGDALQGSDKLERLRVIRAEIGPLREYIEAQHEQERKRYEARVAQELLAWRDHLCNSAG